MRRIPVLSALLTVVAVSVSAQSPVAPGWGAFAGCWVPVPATSAAPQVADPRICVVPTGANSAELVSVVGDKTTERTRIDADGQHHDVSRQGCNGWESAQFSSDGQRLYLRSEQQCLNGLKRTTSGVFALAANGEWINAVNVGADSGNSVRVSRYSPASLTMAIPADIRDGLAAREVSDRTARIAAMSLVGTNDVIEAGRFLSAPVTEAWLAELEQDFRLDEKTLIHLSDAGVPPSVIDVMVAVSNPKVFAVRATGSGIATAPSDSLAARRNARSTSCLTPMVDPWAWYAYDPCDRYNRYSFYRSRGYRFGYDPYFGYSTYDPYGYGYGYGYARPVYIVVRGSAEDVERSHGKMTKDGYRNTGATSRGTAQSDRGSSAPTRPADYGSDRTATSTGSSSTGSSSTGSSSSGGGERTATRKPPAT